MPELMSWHRYDFTGDVYDFTVVSGPTTDPDDATRNYTFMKSIRLNAHGTGFGRMGFSFPIEVNDLRPYMQIRNLRDANGEEIVPDGHWLLTDFGPLIGIWNTISGYRANGALNVTPGEV